MGVAIVCLELCVSGRDLGRGRDVMYTPGSAFGFAASIMVLVICILRRERIEQSFTLCHSVLNVIHRGERFRGVISAFVCD